MSSTPLPGTLADWLTLIEDRHFKAWDLGLERCGEVWRAMDAPVPAPGIFVVAGTNGKGSTVAMLCALLGALGHRYGSYTSPHLTRFNERIRVNGATVDDAMLMEAFERVEAARGEVSLTYFEFTTLAAFDILSRAGLDFAVMEIGLGGRLDAVNLLDGDCAVITPIGLDHQDYLGDDLEAIGREKAGIIRPGRPVVCGEPNPPASVIETAAEQSAPLLRLGREFRIRRWKGGARFQMGGLELDLPLPSLEGAHQLENMATALATLLERLPAAADVPAQLAAGLRSVSLRGRFERLAQQPAIWVDVGHNPMAARAVAATAGDAMRSEGLARCRCVLAMLADKDAAGVAEELAPVVSGWYCAGLEGERGQSGHALAGRLEQAGLSGRLYSFDSVSEALDAAVSDSAKNEAVLAFGSFFTAAEAAQHWSSRNYDK